MSPGAATTAAARPPAALPEAQRWTGRPGRGELAGLPASPAVYLLLDRSGAPVQLATASDLRRVVTARLSDVRRPGRADLAEVVRGVRWRRVCSGFEADWWYWRLARRMYPREYRRLVSFGPAWFLNVEWRAAVPVIRVTERIWCVPGECVGPWPAQKSCQQALDGLGELFDLCRYPEQVRQAPRGTRCAYAEMGRCDAPCDGSAPLAAYRARCRAAWRFACGAVAEWSAQAERRMKAAAAQRRYEQAALLRRQIAFAQSWSTRWSGTVRPERELNCLLAIPVARRRAHKLFLFRRGRLEAGPVVLNRKLGEQAPAWLGAALGRRAPPLAAAQRMEQTWLLAHFLHHRQARAAIRVALPDGASRDELEALVRRKLTPGSGSR